MALSIIYSNLTGRQLRLAVGSNTVAIQGPNDVYVEIARFNAEPDPSLFVWDRITHDYVDAPTSPSFPVSRTRITRGEFIDKWTDAEIAMQHELRLTGTTQQRVNFELIRERLTSRDYVKLTDAKVITAVTYMVNQLAAAGTIAPNDAPTKAARVAAVLAPLTTQEVP